MTQVRKIFGSIVLAIILFLSASPAVMAQSALDDIKARLESEGIAVVDYSTPEGQWGSLPSEWVRYLGESYSSLADLSQDLEDHYIGSGSITDLKRQLAIAEAQKSRLTVQAEINDKNDEIESLQEDLTDAQDEAKDAIAGIVASAEGLNKEDGINLIFNEVDFYYNYRKWGRLPLRIIGILEEEGYESLQDIVDVEGLDNVASALAEIEDLTASDIDFITDSIAILSATGERQLNEVARAVVNTIKNLIAGLAVIWIVVAGARMIFAQGDESVITEQKRAILYGVIGLVAILLVDRGVDFLYGPAGAPRTELTPDQGFSNEVYGIVTFIKALIGTVAILFIVISGVRMLFASGEEDEITRQRQSILWVGVGLILIAVDRIIVENVFIIPTQNSDQIRTSNITTLVNTFGTVMQFILGFVGLLAFGALVYGAATMIMNYGNDEMVQKSKKVIRNAIIGILVVLSAYTIVATLVVFR